MARDQREIPIILLIVSVNIPSDICNFDCTVAS